MPKPKPKPAPRWAKISQAAAYSGYAHRTIWEHVRNGNLPAYMPRGSRIYLVDLNDLDEMIRGGRRAPGDQPAGAR